MLFILILRKIPCVLLLLLLLLLICSFPYLLCRHVCGSTRTAIRPKLQANVCTFTTLYSDAAKTLLKQKLHIFLEYLLLYYYLRTIGCVALVSLPPQNFARPFCYSVYGIEKVGASDVTFKLNYVKNRSADSETVVGKADTFVT